MTILDSSKIKELAGEASTFELFIQYLEDDLEIEYDTLSLDEQAIIDEIWYRIPRVYERTEDNLPHNEEWYERMRRMEEYGWLPKHAMVCIECEKEYFITTSRKVNDTARFCSQRCNAIYGLKHRMKRQSKLEDIIADWLDTLSIEYIRQYSITDDIIATSVDFFMEPNICLYIDGDYWHSLSENRENYTRDILQNIYLPLLGYTVYRITESDILAGYRPFGIIIHFRRKTSKVLK